MTYRQTKIQRGLTLRARILGAVHAFFQARDFLCVETPTLLTANAPEDHIEAESAGRRFLHTSPELCMKRLLAAGYPRIYQVCRVYRKGERGKKHLPEFTLLEWYFAHGTYEDMMVQCEELFAYIAAETGAGDSLCYGGESVSLKAPWERMTVEAAFERYASVSAGRALMENRFEEVLTEEVEPRLGFQTPVFLYEYPAETAALSRLKPADPTVAERFEIYMFGMELCNAFTELTDSVLQRERFEAVNTMRRKAGKPPFPMPEAFLAALPDMPPAAGNALGLDRLVMIFAGAASIDEVVAFTPEEV